MRAREGQLGPVEVRRVRAQDWAASRAIRLESLADTPIGFLELHAEAVRRSDAEWRQRAAAVAQGDERGLWLAWQDARPVGCAGGWRRDGGLAVVVVAVYVSPALRGTDVLDQLLDAVTRWADRLDGVTELRLGVHEDNARARAAYRRRGFVETGGSAPYPPDPGRRELEMVRLLSPRPASGRAAR